MKYKNTIEKSFKIHKFSPRPKQVEIINSILEAYVDEKFENVVFSASTGVGKSLVALVVSDCLSEILNRTELKKSYLLSHTNSLLNQYENSYKDFFDLVKIWGKQNYPCEAMESNAEDCILPMSKTIPSLGDFIKKCSNCEYLKTKQLLESKNYVCTNYSFFFTNMLNSEKPLPKSLLTVYDEGHLVNDVFAGHMKVEFNKNMLESIKKDLEETPLKNKISFFENFYGEILNKKINEENIEDYLRELLDVYKNIASELREMAKYELQDYNKYMFKKYNKLSFKYDLLKQKICDFFSYSYENVIDINEDFIEISPVFVGDMFKKIQNSEYNLFMSATIDSNYISKTFNIEKNNIKFINGGNIFSPENKIVVFCNLDYFNYSNMNNEKFIENICESVYKILLEHKEEKGLIQTTTLKLTEKIKKYLEKKLPKLKIFYQDSENKLKLRDLIDDFKNYNEQAILISPSLFEGLSFDDDYSRFQIFIKAPYYSLGNKRIKYILDKYPDIYKKLALYRCIQGFGRSVRNENDYCITYCLDSNIKKLFNDAENYWKNEFTIFDL